MAAGDVQGVDVVAVFVQAFEDVAEAEGEGDAGAPVEAGEGVEGAVEGEAGDDAEGVGVCQRRAVAVEVGDDVQARGEVGGRVAQLGDAGDDAGVGGGGRVEAVQAQDVVEEGAGGGLAALVHPEAGERGAEVGAPDAG